MKRYLIGLGCSWTQGEGGYTKDIWDSHGGRVQVRGRDDYYLREIEHENSWVNVLCRDYLTDHIPVNLGVRGIGNYAATHQLHFCDTVDFANSTGIIVFMLSGFERLDVFKDDPTHFHNQDDFYSNNEYVHYKWRTAWPHNNDSLFWKAYAKELYSEKFVASHAMMALLDAQLFAKAHGFKLVVANAFNQVMSGDIYQYLHEYTKSLVGKFDWDCYLHETTDYKAFVEKLVILDGRLKPEDWGSYHQYYHKLDRPSTYLTNCEGAHPTIEGYKVIAEELAKFIKYKGYA